MKFSDLKFERDDGRGNKSSQLLQRPGSRTPIVVWRMCHGKYIVYDRTRQFVGETAFLHSLDALDVACLIADLVEAPPPSTMDAGLILAEEEALS